MSNALKKIVLAMREHVKGKPLTKTGAEVPDPTPMAPPVGYKKQPSLHEQIRAMVRSEALKREVEAAGFETVEEADDFEVGDPEDFDPTSPYEHNFDPPVDLAPSPEPHKPPVEGGGAAGVTNNPPASPAPVQAPPIAPEGKSVQST